MYYVLVIFYFYFTAINCQSIITDASDTNIIFDLADITTIENDDLMQLEAFKSTSNDDILNRSNSSEYGKLIWVSLGNPTLVRTPSVRNKTVSSIFHFSSEGFYTYIQMLTKKQRQSLLNAVYDKYKISISINQIVNLILSRFECHLYLYTEGQKTMLTGKVNEFRNFPLRMKFWAPVNSKERKLFEQRINENELEEHSDLDLECDIASRGKELKTNSLKITINQINQLDIIEKIFGPANTTFVTRDQLSTLANEIYTSLNVIEEYNIPEFQFSEEFIQAIISQTASIAFNQVSLDHALNALSKYSTHLDTDLKADTIKSDLGKLYELKKVNDYKYVKLNEENFEALKEDSKISGSVTGKGSFLGIIKVGGSVSGSQEKYKDWTKSGKSLNEQIKELNSENENDVEWKIEGERIVPKSINVAKLNRASFSKTLIFNRIRKQYYDASFQRKISLYTSKYINKQVVTKFPKGTIVAASSQNVLGWFHEDGKGFGDYLGWYLCDGRNETPDLSGRFLVGYDSKNKDYQNVGNVGGLDRVNLTVDELPQHSHSDEGHVHAISLTTSTSGQHTHGYDDVFYHEAPHITSNWINDPTRHGPAQHTHDNDNVGHQMRRTTQYDGLHTHNVDGSVLKGNASISNTGGNKSHENRPPYYVVVYIVFLDI